MKMFRNLMVVLATVLALVGCGQKVEVGPGTVAKVLTQSGYKEGVVQPSKFRLGMCMNFCDKLVLLDASEKSVTEPMSLLMPRDKLNMTFKVRLTMGINPEKYDDVFSRVSATAGKGKGLDYVAWNTVYQNYAQQIIQTESREYLSQFTIAEILSNLEKINGELSARLSDSLSKRTPFITRYAGITDVGYPKIIVEAQENAAERREKVEAEEAQLEISRVTLERELQEQQLKRKVEVAKAEAEAEVNKILAKSMTPEYVKYRELAVMDAIAASDNKVFVPLGALNSIAVQNQIGR